MSTASSFEGIPVKEETPQSSLKIKKKSPYKELYAQEFKAILHHIEIDDGQRTQKPTTS